jgi:ATP-dependent DNA helicase RecG
VFKRLAREARAWLDAPTAARLASIATRARSVAPGDVPEARREDWQKLVAGFAREEAATKRRARVAGLVRACDLFLPATAPAKAASPKAPREPAPLGWGDAVDALPGLGPASREALAKAGVHHVADLVWTLPIAFDDARSPRSVKEALARAAENPLVPERMCVTGIVKTAGFIPMRGRRAVRLVVGDADDPGSTLHVWWFFLAHGVLSIAKPGAALLLTGRIRRDPGKPPRMIHPDLAADEERARVVRPRYPRLGATEAAVRKAIAATLDRVAELPDPVPEPIAEREDMAPVGELLRAVHGTGGVLEAPPSIEIRRALVERLAWGEAFTRAWERLSIEASQGAGGASPLPLDRAVVARLRAELGFPFTKGQSRAIATIGAELAQAVPMRRLLLGDVGTGKTAVALAAAAQCVSAGRQVAILAPTSVLAEQYMDAVAPLARATGASIALIAAGLPAAARRRAEAGLAAGTIAIGVGTHALLREGLTFARLGLVVVDEQHRLGVAQRLTLVQKGVRPHLLSLSATPIPRTLALALRGELKTSTLDERPRGRPPVATEIRPRTAFPALVDEMRALCMRGERAFVVSPRIDVDASDDEDDDGGADDGASSAVRLAEVLADAMRPYAVALIHGSLSPDAKRAAMRAFRSGEAQVLVGTTVIEVGVDVPEATLMVVDGAEGFGLAQLHQLRGRVGRGDRPGRCVLLHDEPLDERAERRLRALCELSSGADIARADLELRGAGDLGGTRQSGIEEDLLYLDPASPPAWLGRIDADARRIFAEDPSLSLPAHRALALSVRRLAAAIAVREEAG